MVYPFLSAYLHSRGDVGCGKTMLMDMLYDTLPSAIHKVRVHFHAFMLDIHKLASLWNRANDRQSHLEKMTHPQTDPLPAITNRIAKNTTVLFLDEFQVTDIADAMILRRLLTMLLARGVVLVTTSNRHPRDLYRNGIQRESFLPAIDVSPSHHQFLTQASPISFTRHQS
jgi:peroxisome-assembly ATPase